MNWRKALRLVAVILVLALFWRQAAMAAGNISITRQYSPSANAAITTTAGDNTGFETTPSNAYANDAIVATDTNSGSGDNSVPTGTGTDKHNYYNFGISLPSGATINGIEVRADILVDLLTNAPYTAIRLSWDTGTSWTTEKSLTLTATAETTYNYGSSIDTWGRTWTATELNNTNFRVQVINGDTGAPNSRDFSLDWVRVLVTFTAPWDSHTDSGRADPPEDTFASPNTTVYMKGTGFATGNYDVGYYDGDSLGGGQWVVTDVNKAVAGDGILNVEYTLTTNPTAAAGTWHVLVQPALATAFPSDYNTAVGTPDTYDILANDSFTAEASAIPEIPTVIAGIAVAGACAGLYWWMRKRRLDYVQA
jgi:hypothetical protein